MLTRSSRSSISRSGSPCPRADGSLSPARVKKRPSEANSSSLSVVSAGTRKRRLSPSLNFSSDGSSTRPRAARIQPRSERITVIGSRATSASTVAEASIVGASSKVERRLPTAVFGPSTSRTWRRPAPTSFHCCPSELSMPWMPSRSSARSACSRRNSISSSLASWRRRVLRMASAWMSSISNVAISLALGSSSKRTMRITSSRLRKTINRPARMCRRCSILPSRNSARRTITSRR